MRLHVCGVVSNFTATNACPGTIQILTSYPIDLAKEFVILYIGKMAYTNQIRIL